MRLGGHRRWVPLNTNIAKFLQSSIKRTLGKVPKVSV